MFFIPVILEKLLTQENRVLEYWTNKKKRLDQNQQWVIIIKIEESWTNTNCLYIHEFFEMLSSAPYRHHCHHGSAQVCPVWEVCQAIPCLDQGGGRHLPQHPHPGDYHHDQAQQGWWCWGRSWVWVWKCLTSGGEHLRGDGAAFGGAQLFQGESSRDQREGGIFWRWRNFFSKQNLTFWSGEVAAAAGGYFSWEGPCART